jgi:DNA-binding response OmpR family regulator
LKHVLIADDEEMVLKLLARFLERLNYLAIGCLNGTEAMERLVLKKDDIGLAILDLNLPDITGIQLAIHLKEIKPCLKIIISTGDPITASEINNAYGHQLVDKVLNKPFSLSIFENVIHGILGKSL